MVTASPTCDQGGPESARPLTLEIYQGRGPSQHFPVRIRSLSARGVILKAAEVPGDFDLEGCRSRDAVIHLPSGGVPEVKGSLLWARPRGEDGSEVVFGMELGSSDLKVRRALEEHLLAFPQDIKNMWDHWDAVHDDYEVFGPAPPPASAKGPNASGAAPAITPKQPKSTLMLDNIPESDHTIYWVGFGAVLAGLSVYFLAPETYRLFGVILATYGSLSIAGKSVWSLVQKRPRPQG